jgi:hypothetical protein
MEPLSSTAKRVLSGMVGGWQPVANAGTSEPDLAQRGRDH